MEQKYSPEFIDNFLKERLGEFLITRGINIDKSTDFDITENIVDLGPTSIEMVRFLMKVEKKFEIYFEELELVKENLDQLRTIEKFRNRILAKLEYKRNFLNKHFPPARGCNDKRN